MSVAKNIFKTGLVRHNIAGCNANSTKNPFLEAWAEYPTSALGTPCTYICRNKDFPRERGRPVDFLSKVGKGETLYWAFLSFL